jgi:hypothetical protein
VRPLCRFLLALSIVSICARDAAGATDVPKKVSAAELSRLVAASQSMPDGELAQRFSGVVLTDRLSGTRFADLTNMLSGEKSRTALMLLADQSIFLPPPADEMPDDAAPNAAATRQMLVNIVNYVNTTVRQLPNLMATRFTNGFEDRPREERLISTGVESLDDLPLHWVGSLGVEVTYRDRQEVEDKKVKVEKKGNGVGGLMTTGEFGPILSTVLSDALKGKITWARWEKSSDGTMAVFHYEVPEDRSNYHVQFCCFVDGYSSDGTPESKVFNERSAYHGDLVFSPVDGSIRLLTLEADLPGGGLVSGAGIAIEYAATAIGGRSYICPVRSVSMLRAHTVQQSGAIARSNYKGPAKTFLNDVTFSNYRRFGSETKILTSSPEN